MKFFHLSDLHIGLKLINHDLREDQEYILKQIISIAEEKKADAVLIAGDVYDRPVPSEWAVGLFDRFLSGLSDRGFCVFVISGNHDSDERLNFGSSLLKARNVFISAKYEGKLQREDFTDSCGEVRVYLLPFVKASQVRHFFPDEKIETYEDAVRAALAHGGIDPSARNILVAHQFVIGTGGGVSFGGSESSAVRNVGLVEQISASCFDAFDYTALGHIHSAQQVGRREVRYAGSPLKYSLSEEGNEKSVTFAELGEKGDVRIELIPLRPLRDLRHIKGKMEQLLSNDIITDTDDYIYATLTDEELIDDAMGIFRRYYPRTVRIDYDNSHTREISAAVFSPAEEEKSFSALISEFYHEMYGCPISEEELKEVLDVAKEAGVSDETN